MRTAILAVLAALGGACAHADTGARAADFALSQVAEGDVSAPAADASSPVEALLAADTARLIAQARGQMEAGQDVGAWSTVVFVDEFMNGRYGRAREALERMPDGVSGGAADMFEPFLLVAEQRGPFALERLEHGAGGLPDPLPAIARALVLESLGRLAEARTAYATLERGMDTSPPPRGEPRTEADFLRMLAAPRTSQTLYRAALVAHRLGERVEARRLYELVQGFAPGSIDVAANLARLEAGQAPRESPLDARRALGRWLLVLSDYLQQTDGLAAVMQAQGPLEGLASPVGSLFLQLGIALDPSADDWSLAAAQQLMEARGYAGAARILDRIGADSLFAADAELTRASLALRQDQDEQAAAAARRAASRARDRWAILSGAGDILRLTRHDSEAIAQHDRALALAPTPRDRADVLAYRAYAHRFAGRIAPAVADARAALALSQEDGVRYAYIAILMDDAAAWTEAIALARAMFAEQPESSTRLNSLGYALIQRPEGLEEGYRLLWRGFSTAGDEYAIIDSLGWAYYLHGAFAEARDLIERSRDLSTNDPNPEVLDHLGDVYWRLNERERARTAWREALAARPDAIRRASLEAKIARGLTTPAPTQRALPRVDLPSAPATRTDT